MGWSDISISMTGPIVNSAILHFTDRWNYIFGQKYNTDDGAAKYQKIENAIRHARPAPGLIEHGEREAGEMFGGLQRHFTKHFGHWGGESGREERSHDEGSGEDHGAHIQFCRR